MRDESKRCSTLGCDEKQRNKEIERETREKGELGTALFFFLQLFMIDHVVPIDFMRHAHPTPPHGGWRTISP
jgi:hypothetical protein